MAWELQVKRRTMKIQSKISQPMKIIRYSHSNSPIIDLNYLLAGRRVFSPLLRSATHSSQLAPNRGVEWYESKESYVARIDLPGVKKNDLKIEVNEGLLQLSAEKSCVRGESPNVEKFERALRLPKGVDPEAISARLEDGILELTLGKVEELKPYQIEIQ